MFRSSLLAIVVLIASWTAISTAQLPGDFDFDGAYSCSDIDSLSAEISNNGANLDFDLNGDGQVTQTDVTDWLQIVGDATMGAPLPYGDFNLNGNVDQQDFGVWNSTKFSNATGWCSGDANSDGGVDVVDYLVMRNNLFQAGISGHGPIPIPSEEGRFVYDTSSGRMFASFASEMTAWVVPGPEPLSIDNFDGIDEGLFWNPTYFNGSEQWFARRLTEAVGVSGTHVLATYPEGLTESDFGIVQYGADRDVNDLAGILSNEVEAFDVIPGDANLDGFVDVSDFNLWNANKFSDLDSNWGQGDFNFDGQVDVSDFNIWNQFKFRSSFDSAVVPEPTAATLLLIGIMGMLRRKKFA